MVQIMHTQVLFISVKMKYFNKQVSEGKSYTWIRYIFKQEQPI